jgi:hypothetical protein
MLKLLEGFYLNKYVFNVFAPSPYQSNPALTPVEIRRRVDELLRSMRFSVRGDGQSARSGNRLANPIVFRVFTGNNIGVSGLPVRVMYENNDIITTGTLNHNGEINVSAAARRIQGNRGNIFVRIHNESFQNIDSGLFQFNVAEAHFTIQVDADTPIHLTVTDENGNRNIPAETRIGQIISRTRYPLGGAGSPAFWRGVVSYDTSSSGNMFHATVSVYIQVGVTRTNEVIRNLSAIGVAQSTQSEAHARTMALQNLDISNDDIGFSMRAVENRLNR